MMKNTFSILGCCVSRDIFNYLDNEIYVPISTLGGDLVNSVSMTDSTSITELYSYLDKFEFKTNFQEKIMRLLFSGKIYSSFMDAKADYLILDIANERLPLQIYEYNDSKKIIPCVWTTHKFSKLLNNDPMFHLRDWHLPCKYPDAWKRRLNEMVNIINDNYPADRIIFIETRLVNKIRDDENNIFYDLDKDIEEIKKIYPGIDSNDIRIKQNEIIQLAEDYILPRLNGFIKIPFLENVFGNTLHHLGVHPLHLDDLYYEYASECIKIIVKDSDVEWNDRKLMLIRQINNLKEIYERKLKRLIGLSRTYK